MVRGGCEHAHYPAPLLAVAALEAPTASLPFPVEPLDSRSWTALLSAAVAHRVIGLLRAAVEEGVLPSTPWQAEQARAAHRARALRVLSLERELVVLAESMDASGIQTRVLKGAAVAKLDYARPGVRSFVDLDILVRSSDIDRAVRHLVSAGFARTLEQPRPGFDRRFDKGVTLRSPSGYELDLHRTFVLGPWGTRVGLDDLWDDGESFEVGGRDLRALSRPNRFLHACYHAALGNWPLRLASLRDVAEMLPTAEQDRGVVFQRMASWRVEAIVAMAISDTVRLLGLESDGELVSWARAYVPTARDEAWLALHTRVDKTFTAQALATVPAIPGMRDKLAYIRALALPDERYTAGRHSSMMRRLRFAILEARRGTRA